MSHHQDQARIDPLLLLLIGCALVLACVASTPTDAAPADPSTTPPAGPQAPARPSVPSATPARNPQALDVLRQLAGLYGPAKNYQVTIDGQYRQTVKQKTTTRRLHARLLFAKPDKYELVRGSDDQTLLIRCDGKTLTRYRPDLQQYITEPAPLLDTPRSEPALCTVVGAALFLDDPLAALLEECEKLEYLGKQPIDDRPCHHLRLTRPQGLLELWVQADGPPLLLRARLDQAPAIRQAGRLGSIVTTLDYTDWQLDADLPADRFTFKPPDQAQQVQAFHPTPLTGKPAPDFELPSLEGKTVKLADLKGKVVVLDFWATWCPPCVAALPLWKQVTDPLAGRGVVFFAVNQRESVEKIKAFLEKQQLDLAVLLDSTGAVGRRYRVGAIPHSVIIDRQGRIAHVHIGLTADFKTKVTEQLKRLLDQDRPSPPNPAGPAPASPGAG